MLYGKYKVFLEGLKGKIPAERLHTNLSERIAVSEDGGIYRYIPKLVVVVDSEEEVAWVLEIALKSEVSVTFRGTGSSNAGQSLTGAVLVVTSCSWNRCEVLDQGERIRVACGTTLKEINKTLSKYDRTIDFETYSKAATIGGIISDFRFGYLASNPYWLSKQIESIRVVLYDGTVIDTGLESIEQIQFNSQNRLVNELKQLQRSVIANEPLSKELAEKQRTNSYGFQLASLVEEDNLLDVIRRMMLGVSGTLGFISEIVLKTKPIKEHLVYGLVKASKSEWLNELSDELKADVFESAIWFEKNGVKLLQKISAINKNFNIEEGDSFALLFKLSANSSRELIAKQKYLEGFGGCSEIVFSDSITRNDFIASVLRRLRAEFLKECSNCYSSLFLSFQFPCGNLTSALPDLKGFIEAYKDEYVYWINPLQQSLDLQIPLKRFDSEDPERLYLLLEGISKLVATEYRGILSCHGGLGRLMTGFLRIELNNDRILLMNRIKRIFDPYLILNPDILMQNRGMISSKNLLSVLGNYNEISHCTTCGNCEECTHNVGCSLRKKLQLIRVMKEWYANNPSGEQLKHLVGETAQLFSEELSDSYLQKCPMGVTKEDLVLPDYLVKLVEEKKKSRSFWSKARQSFSMS